MSEIEEPEDSRPLIEPSCFSSRELPCDPQEFMRQMKEVWGDQVDFVRFTIVSDEHPNPPYPNALYFEGWPIAPWKHDPPGKEAPFNYPLTSVETIAPIKGTSHG